MLFNSKFPIIKLSEIKLNPIEKKSKKLSQEDQKRFVEAVETELLNLHEGNYARYWIKPSQFKIWKENWAHNND